MTVSDPLAHVFPLTTDALTADVPVVSRLARPGVVVENESTDVVPDVQVELFVTSVLPLVAVNWTVGVVDKVNGP